MSAARWTPAEDAVLREHYRSTPTRVIAARLGRTYRACTKRAQRLHVQRARGPSKVRATEPTVASCFTAGWPRYPQRITRALSRLAESRPCAQTYAREKARILGALNDERHA